MSAPDLSMKDASRRRRFFFDLDRALSDSDSDRIVFDRAKREVCGLDVHGVQYQRHILHCTELPLAQGF